MKNFFFGFKIEVHVDSKLTFIISDKSSDEGLRVIFELFVDDHVDDTVSLMNLKRIVEELQEEKGIEQVKKLLLLKGASNARLTFPEFVD